MIPSFSDSSNSLSRRKASSRHLSKVAGTLRSKNVVRRVTLKMIRRRSRDERIPTMSSMSILIGLRKK